MKRLVRSEWPVILGISLYCIFYYYASTLYPGGSQANIHTYGFDWINNYWCNLLNERALNGQVNPARTYAIFGTVVLSLTMIWFFVRFALLLGVNKSYQSTIIAFGIISMVFAIFLYTSYHDIASILSGGAGVIALTASFYQLYLHKRFSSVYYGLWCMAIIAINNFIYFSGFKLEWLPLIQKATLLFIFGWVLTVNQALSKI
ncbi:MAG: hypothetical protein IPG82_08575 [Saprospiraceae bacterium]|nr:hypothetical protein [Saprospiraceae bacterium]MBK8778811.1 hypothetical protein [Saprospiraceae bacterium]